MVKSGAKYRSQACTTEIIVIRAGGGDLALECGGHPMIDPKESADNEVSLDLQFSRGSILGKRYTTEDGLVELLVTKPGEGTLASSGIALSLKEPKPLPSSD